MEEEDVNTSAAFILKERHQPQDEEEVTVHETLVIHTETREQTSVTAGIFLNEKRRRKRRSYKCYKQLNCCFTSNYFFFILIIFGVHIYRFVTLEMKNKRLEARNQELKMQANNLTEQLRDLETQWIVMNVSRAQWSINQYCPQKLSGKLSDSSQRVCERCQKNWLYNQSSCYIIKNLAEKTWEEAQRDCRGNSSDLVVVSNKDEKMFVNEKIGHRGDATKGYWLGLRVEDGKWKWVNGNDLINNSWIQDSTSGHCAVSHQDGGWKSVSCDEKHEWICEKEALSV